MEANNTNNLYVWRAGVLIGPANFQVDSKDNRNTLNSLDRLDSLDSLDSFALQGCAQLKVV